MPCKRDKYLGVMLSVQEKEVIRKIAEDEGVPISVVVRRLVRFAGKRCGLWPLPQEVAQEVSYDDSKK